MLASKQSRDSRLPLHVNIPSSQIPPLATFGEYTMYPMEYCTEDQVAKLFPEVCQRGNPVLQGRPFADLELLGRAMYRKSATLRLGQVAMYQGEPIALGCTWDMAEGGVWKDSGLEMPASCAAHAACGKACFDAFAEKNTGKKTLFAAFYGCLPPHNVALFGYLGISAWVMGSALGFEDTFQFTLLPALTGRGLWSEQDTNPNDTINWSIKFSDVAPADPVVAMQLQELAGNINLSLTRLGYIFSPEYLKYAASIVRLKTGEELFQPSQLIALNQLKWLQQTQSSNVITSRL